jgi:hypothetical protein
MEEIINNLKNYLQNKNIYNEDDFKKSNHNDIYFNINRLKELVKVDFKIPHSKIKEFGSNEYILISDIPNYIKNINDVRQYWIVDIHEIFKLTTIIKTNGLNIISNTNQINYSGQFMFTYTLWKFLQTNFPKMTITIEENFLKRLGIDIETHKGPRVDIVIDQIKLVLEFDEKQHETFEHVEKDEIRDNIIRAFGYEVIRFKEKSNLIIFFLTLKQIITSKELDDNLDLFGQNIINYFLKNNIGNEEMLNLLVKEQTIDIINQVDFKDIGKEPREINLNSNVFQWLGISTKSDKEKIKKMLDDFDSEEFPYIENSSDLFDIILSPNAFEMLLSRIDANEYESIAALRKCYIDIKNKLLQELYQRALKIQQKKDSMSNLVKYIYDEGYDRGTKDTSAKHIQLQKKCNLLEYENKTLKDIIDNTLPKDKRGHKKQNLIPIPKKLQIGKSICQEIPELIYTDNSDDFVEELQLKVIHEQNKHKYKISKSITECIKEIKNKLDINEESNSLINGIIFKCKIIYSTSYSDEPNIVKKKKTNIIIKNESDNEEI